VFGAQSLHKLLVRLLLATLVEHGHVGLATIQCLARLAEAAGEAVVDERMPEDSLECFLDGHLALGGAISRDLDLVGGFDGGDFFSCVRLVAVVLVSMLLS